MTRQIAFSLLLAATAMPAVFNPPAAFAQQSTAPVLQVDEALSTSPTEEKWGLSFEQNDDATFTIGNSSTAFTLSIGEATVNLVGQRCAGRNDIWAGKTVSFFDDGENVKYADAQLETHWVEASRVSTAHLQVDVTFESPTLTKKIVFRLYPDSEMLGCDGYYRGTASGRDANATRLLALETRQRHWKYKAVEFFDRTDENNNLVHEREIIGYEVNQRLRGNLLLAQDLISGQAFVLVKEAPSSFSQINHPGHDFELSKFGMATVGVGFETKDLKPNHWTKSYSVAVSSCDPQPLASLTTLRRYQKSLRPHDNAWDEMIMMNNWGDRNRDSRYSEEFVRQEIDACKRLGITHFQIDDGWQQGLSKNSSDSSGKKWDQWDLGDWQPHRDRFPNGFQPVVDYARKQGITLGLWFAPSNADSFANWQQDAQVIINLNKQFGIKYFKIDGIRLPNKLAEENLRKMYDLVLTETDQNVFFNVDATAHDRGGFHFLYEYGGNIFLENRYTTFKKYYYPYQTLRNLWMLSRYVPAERFQIEFLNKWKNQANYDQDDIFSPINVPFAYTFAITMAAQPLAWFEGTGLPAEAFDVAPLIKKYSKIRHEFHAGDIFPIGQEPTGRSWTGFQSIAGKDAGFLLIYRELNDKPQHALVTHLDPGSQYSFTKVLGQGRVDTTIDAAGRANVSIPDAHGFLLVRYQRK